MVFSMKIIKGNSLQFTAASHEDPTSPGAFKKVLLARGALPPGGQLAMVNWAKIPPLRSFALHYHEDMFEVFIFTSGDGVMTVDSEEEAVGAGDAVVVPPKAQHKLTNRSEISELNYVVFGISYGENGKTIVI